MTEAALPTVDQAKACAEQSSQGGNLLKWLLPCGVIFAGCWAIKSLFSSFIGKIIMWGGILLLGGALLKGFTGKGIGDFIPDWIKNLLPECLRNFFGGSGSKKSEAAKGDSVVVNALDKPTVEGQQPAASEKGKKKYAKLGLEPSYEGQQPIGQDAQGNPLYAQGVVKSYTPAWKDQEPVGVDGQGPYYEVFPQRPVVERTWGGYAQQVVANTFFGQFCSTPQYEGQPGCGKNAKGDVFYAKLGERPFYEGQQPCTTVDGQPRYTQNVKLSTDFAYSGQQPVAELDDGTKLYEVSCRSTSLKTFQTGHRALRFLNTSKVGTKLFKTAVRTGGKLVHYTPKFAKPVVRVGTKLALTGAKTAGKIGSKKIPGVGLVISGAEMVRMGANGDWIGVGMEAASAALSTGAYIVGGLTFGLAAPVSAAMVAGSVGIDVANAAREAHLQNGKG